MSTADKWRNRVLMLLVGCMAYFLVGGAIRGWAASSDIGAAQEDAHALRLEVDRLTGRIEKLEIALKTK